MTVLRGASRRPSGGGDFFSADYLCLKNILQTKVEINSFQAAKRSASRLKHP